MPPAKFVTITPKDEEGAEMEHVLIHSLHTCAIHEGQPFVDQFTLYAGNEGSRNSCGWCYSLVPPKLWAEWQRRFRLAQKLEGR